MAIAGLMLVSCNTIYEYSDCISLDEPHSINFVLAIDPPGATRATWDDAEPNDAIGTGFENRILPESLRVAIYTTDNTLVGMVEELVYWPINEDGSRYQFKGIVPEALLNNASSLPAGTAPDYKFMVYANCTEDDNATMTYSYDDLDITTGAIPMWGVKQANISNLLRNRVQELGVISLLRAVAKVEVIIDETLTECTINSVSINYHNRKGYVLPTGWDSASSTTELDRDAIFRGYRSLHTSAHNFIEAESGRKYIMYLPEYDNQLFADYEAKLTVSVNYNATTLNFPDALQFKSYENGRQIGRAHV